MEGAVFSGDALAEDAGVFVDEDGGRRRRRSEIAVVLKLLRAKQPRRESADQFGGLARHRFTSLSLSPRIMRGIQSMNFQSRVE